MKNHSQRVWLKDYTQDDINFHHDLLKQATNGVSLKQIFNFLLIFFFSVRSALICLKQSNLKSY